VFGEIDLWETPGTPSDQGVPICSIPITNYYFLTASM
jgi:hypothetical protein